MGPFIRLITYLLALIYNLIKAKIENIRIYELTQKYWIINMILTSNIIRRFESDLIFDFFSELKILILDFLLFTKY